MASDEHGGEHDRRRGGEQSGEDLLGLLGRWSADERRRQASAARVRERRLRQVQAESATLSGLLVDLAESGRAVVVLVAGHRLVGRLLAVGSDFCALEERAGHSTLVRASAIRALWPAGAEAGGGVPGGDRRAVLRMAFDDAVAQLAGELMPARLWLPGDEVVEGQLVAAGADLLTVRTPNRSHIYVSLPLVRACSLV